MSCDDEGRAGLAEGILPHRSLCQFQIVFGILEINKREKGRGRRGSDGEQREEGRKGGRGEGGKGGKEG